MKFILGILFSIALGFIAVACAPESRDRRGGTWGDVQKDNGTDCYVGPDEVRFSAFALTVLKCEGKLVMLGTLCFHRMHPLVDLEAETLMRGAGYSRLVKLMPQTTDKILACVNADGREWVERKWRTL